MLCQLPSYYSNLHIAFPRLISTTASASSSCWEYRSFGRVRTTQQLLFRRVGGGVGCAVSGWPLGNSRGGTEVRVVREMAEGVGAANDEVLSSGLGEMGLTIKKEKSSEKLLFIFGVITDIQYADIDDGKSFLGVPRYYRHALEGLRRAVEAWNGRGDLAFAIHFGDIVDGYCPKDQSTVAFQRVLSEFEKFKGGHVYHMIGNHCLYNLPRHELNNVLEIPTSEDGHSYYSFSPVPEFQFLVLDGYDVSILGWPEEHPHTKVAIELLNTRNPNEEKNSPNGLTGVNRRFVKFNGGVGKEQLAWIEKSLQEATAAGQKVVICCHLPMDPSATSPTTLLWNYNTVMQVVHKYNCVVACLAGHNHEYGHSVDAHGIHHHVLEAVLECPPGTDAFGHVEVYSDHLSLVGIDRMRSVDMFF